METPLDLELQPDQQRKYPVSLRRYLVLVLILIVINIFSYTVTLLTSPRFGLNLALVTSINTMTWVLLLCSIPIGLLVALIRYKGLSYREKYIPAILLVYFVVEGLIFIASFVPAIILLLER